MKLSFSKKNLFFYIIFSLAVLSFVVSAIFYAGNYKKKFTFIFPSADEGKYVVETRFFQKYDRNLTNLSSYEYYVSKYVDDLLLGSTLERTKLLFRLGTRADECFFRDDVLYLNLSKDLLTVGNETVNINEGVELLNLNIKKNFSRIKKIELFVDGKYAFENSDFNEKSMKIGF